MSHTFDSGYEVGSKTSIKDKLSRKVKLSFTKTTQKLRTPQKCNSESDYERLQDYHNKIKNQKEALRKIDDQWKKYLTRIEEIDKISSEFESDLIRFLNLYEKASESLKKSTFYFPKIKDISFVAEIFESKRHLDTESKKIKTAEEHYHVYLANKKLYEKATEMKKEREKQTMEAACSIFLEDIENLDKTLPHSIEMSREKLHKCMIAYFDEKVQHLNMELEATKNMQKLLKEVGSLSSFPSSSSVPRSPGCFTAGPVDEQVLLSPNENSEVSDVKGMQDRSESSPNKPNSPKISPKQTHLVSNTRDPLAAVLTQSETAPTSASVHTTNNTTQDGESSESSISDLTSRAPPFDVIAAYPFTSEENDELQFEADEVITVLPWSDPENEEVGWLYGRRKKTGQKGLFPANYVRQVTP